MTNVSELTTSYSLDGTDISETTRARIYRLVEDKGRKQLIKYMLLFSAMELYPCKSGLKKFPRDLVKLIPTFF
jgi:hypothetical protein